MDNTDTTPAPRVRSAARTIEILQILARSSGSVSVTDIVENLGASRQSVYHLLHTLEQMNVVQKSQNRGYEFGAGMLPIVTSFLHQFTPQDVLSPIVSNLAQVSGETAYAAAWLGGEVAVIASATRAQRLKSPQLPLGTLGDTHARASGKLLLSMMPDAAVRDFLDTHTLNARTKNTITDRAVFLQDIEEIRENGYATDLGEYSDQTYCIAVPFFPIPSYVIAISAPKKRFDDNFESYLSALRQYAAKI